MNLLLSMMLSSNLLFILICIVDFICGKQFNSNWKSHMLKISFVMAVVPIVYFKYYFIMPILSFLKVSAKHSNASFSGTDLLVITAPRGVNITLSLKWEIIIIFIWFVIGTTSFLLRVYFYLKQNKLARQSMTIVSQSKILEILYRHKAELGIRKKIVIYTCKGEFTPFTCGVIKPFILIPGNLKEKEINYVIHHELCHIKYHDNLFIFIRLIVVALYWFNPLIYLMDRFVERECELACDEFVVKTHDLSERYEYANLIINFSILDNKSQDPLSMFFCKKQNCIKERMYYIMRPKNMNKKAKLASFFIALCMILCSSLSAFAYEVPSNAKVSEANGKPVFIDSKEVIEFHTSNNVARDSYNITKILFEHQFVGKDGTVYNAENPTPNAACDHNYVSGELTSHIKKSDGGCEVKYYNAKRCTKCGAIVKGSLIKTVTYVKCTH